MKTVTAAEVWGGTGHFNVGFGIRVEANPHLYRLPRIARRWWTNPDGSPARERWRVTQVKSSSERRAIEIIFRTNHYRLALRHALHISGVMRKKVIDRKNRLIRHAPELLQMCKEAHSCLLHESAVAQVMERLVSVITAIEPDWAPEATSD